MSARQMICCPSSDASNSTATSAVDDEAPAGPEGAELTVVPLRLFDALKVVKSRSRVRGRQPPAA